MRIIYIPCDHCDAISATSIKENKNTLAENLDAFQSPSKFIKSTDINLIKIISNKKIIFSEIYI